MAPVFMHRLDGGTDVVWGVSFVCTLVHISLYDGLHFHSVLGQLTSDPLCLQKQTIWI